MEGSSLIKKIIEFDNAERIGYAFESGHPSDFADFGSRRRKNHDEEWHAPGFYSAEYPEFSDFHGFLRKDEYGNLWGKMIQDPSRQGEVLRGVLSDWQMLGDYDFPDLSHFSRFEHIEAETALKENQGKFKMGSLPGFPFAIMRYMRKMENFLADLLLEKDNVLILKKMVETELCGMIENYGDLGMDGVFFCEDWGTQDRLLISPALWRELFKPSFAKLCDLAHKKGMYVFMHSCGYIYEILEDLIETGIDVFQFDQPALMGIDRISAIFASRATLFSSVDIQMTLPTGDRALIEHEAARLIDSFFRNGGGFIARDYGDYNTIKVRPEWSGWMRDAFIRHGAAAK